MMNMNYSQDAAKAFKQISVRSRAGTPSHMFNMLTSRAQQFSGRAAVVFKTRVGKIAGRQGGVIENIEPRRISIESTSFSDEEDVK